MSEYNSCKLFSSQRYGKETLILKLNNNIIHSMREKNGTYIYKEAFENSDS